MGLCEQERMVLDLEGRTRVAEGGMLQGAMAMQHVRDRGRVVTKIWCVHMCAALPQGNRDMPAITDANVALGRIVPDAFPKVQYFISPVLPPLYYPFNCTAIVLHLTRVIPMKQT